MGKRKTIKKHKKRYYSTDDSSSSDPDTDSDQSSSESEEEERERSSRRRSKKKYKLVSSRKRSKSSRSSSKSKRRVSDSGDESGSGSDKDDDDDDYFEAEIVVRAILLKFPGISPELTKLLQTVDDGKAVDISGVSEKPLKRRLKKLFVLLNLKEKDDGVFLLRSNARPTLEVFGALINSENQVSEQRTGKGEEKATPPSSPIATETALQCVTALPFLQPPPRKRKARTLGSAVTTKTAPQCDTAPPLTVQAHPESGGAAAGFSDADDALVVKCSNRDACDTEIRDADLCDDLSDGDNHVSADNCDHDDDKKKSGGRSTLMEEMKMRRASGRKLKLEFNDNGVAIGRWRAKYMSYIGALGRSKVNICFPNWKAVPADVKEHIWQEVSSVFDVDASRRNQVIQIAGARWKDFKSKLTNRYITSKKDGDESPFATYKFIDQETWDKFVASRQSQEFQDISEANRVRQAKNKCTHRLSRGGYLKLEQTLIAELQASQSDSASSTISPEIPRAELWKRARINKKGEYTTEESMIIAQKIDSLSQQASQGKFIPEGRRDILAVALDKEEHPGRVRGVPGGVGIKEYFGKSSRRGRLPAGAVSTEELEVIKAQIKEETRIEIEQRLQAGAVSTEELEEIKALIKEETRVEMEELFEQKMSSMFKQMGLPFPPNKDTDCPTNMADSLPRIWQM